MSATRLPPLDRPPEAAHTRTSLGRAAVLGVALFLASIGTFPPEPAPQAGSATAPEIRAFAYEHATTLRVNLIAGLVVIGLLVWFMIELGRLIRAARPDSVAPAALTVAVSIVAANSLLVTAVWAMFGRPVELEAVSDRTLLTLFDLLAATNWLQKLVVLGPGMLLVAMVSLLALRHRLLARWVCWAGLLLVAAGATSIVSLVLPDTGIDPFVLALFGWWLWPLAVSCALAVRWYTRSRP
jgi:hypothetical protein